MRIVHVATNITTHFGVLDDDGNVIPQEPINAQVQIFTREKFAEAFDLIEKQRDEAAGRMDGVIGGEPETSTHD